MRKLTLHARIEIALVTALLLGSCNGTGPSAHDEMIDIADDAIDASGLSGRLEELASRVEELEAKAALNSANIDALFSNAAADRETANDNAELSNQAWNRIARIEARLGM